MIELFELLLVDACQKNDLHTVKFLIDNGIDVNKIEVHGWTPLHLACLKGHLEMAKLLLKRKANPNVIAPNGLTAKQLCPAIKPYIREDICSLM